VSATAVTAVSASVIVSTCPLFRDGLQPTLPLLSTATPCDALAATPWLFTATAVVAVVNVGSPLCAVKRVAVKRVAVGVDGVTAVVGRGVAAAVAVTLGGALELNKYVAVCGSVLQCVAVCCSVGVAAALESALELNIPVNVTEGVRGERILVLVAPAPKGVAAALPNGVPPLPNTPRLLAVAVCLQWLVLVAPALDDTPPLPNAHRVLANGVTQ